MKRNRFFNEGISYLKSILFVLMVGFGMLLPNSAWAQETISVKGVVKDAEGVPLPGVNIIEKGTMNGTTTNINGDYTIVVQSADAVLTFSSIGFANQEVNLDGRREIDIVLAEEVQRLEEIVVIGYGVKKKESVVGAITQTDGESLMQAGGVSNVGEALQGRLPGVITIIGNNQPGESDLKIYIRGQSSWNGEGQPLILVDGIERSMNDIDFNEIDNISVLKDASATAVFGVKGADGVILLTTKRGLRGRAQLSLSVNSTVKMYSKLPKKLSSYDAALIGNEAIMREVMKTRTAWDDYLPLEIAEKYRNPATLEESYIYPNVDWEDVILKDYAMDHRVNISIRGGSDFAKYFGSLSYQSVSDIFNGKAYNNNKGYASEYSYDRFNYRSNLDFDITNSTEFSVNLSGYYGVQQKPLDDMMIPLFSLYSFGPSIYTPIYPDGYYGRFVSHDWGTQNPVVILTSTGYNTYNKFQINSDFELKQDLDFIVQGLSFKGKVSFDNYMQSRQNLNDPSINQVNNVFYRVYDKEGNETIVTPPGSNDFDFVIQPWTLDPTEVDENTRTRRLNYELSLFFNRAFAEKHNITVLFLFKREEYAEDEIDDINIAAGFPSFREDWVGRFTYDYASRYFLDINGAYNGSEKFGPGYRFDLFPSVALGWMISNEGFMSNMTWLDKLKIRGSYGLVGNDKFDERFKYLSQWSHGNAAYLVPSRFNGLSPYEWYFQSTVGNADLQWEVSRKSNIGVEFAMLRNLLSVEFDYFTENRDKIMIYGRERSVPIFFGIDPPDFNAGKVEVKGYELVAGLNHYFSNGISVNASYSITDAKDKVIYAEDPGFTPDYQKKAGYPIDQPTNAIPGDIIQSWDDVYMATELGSGQAHRRIGYYDLVDFNIDGIYETAYDNAPFGYPARPQRTWNFTGGMGYKGLNLMFQFYGTQNASRLYITSSFTRGDYLFYEHRLGYWSKENPNSTKTLDRWTNEQAVSDPNKNWYDASLVRLKTVEISYDIPKKICERIRVDGLRIFANGNNLYLWTDMPDDREFNSLENSGTDYRGDYPTMKRFNFGFNLNF
jgi:TonB-linked SusC/RagA family outer membrane protein